MHYTLGLSCKSPSYHLWMGIHSWLSSSAMNIHPHAGAFVITAGAILGICAGLLWTAQGSLMLAYPTEDQKGKFIGIFWGIFNLGAVVGASVSLGQNFHSKVRMQYFVLVTCRFFKKTNELFDSRQTLVSHVFFSQLTIKSLNSLL